MKSLVNISLAAVLATSSIVAAAPAAMAKDRHHHEMCISDKDLGGIIVVGAILGAVTGGVGSAVVWGGAYAVGGAAIGGGAGVLIGVHHRHHDCD